MNFNDKFFEFEERLRAAIQAWQAQVRPAPSVAGCNEQRFNELALDLFALQFEHNDPYRRFCISRGVAPGILEDWSEIPAVPTSAFKELDLSCLPKEMRTAVFHSSGTTEQRPSRHYHNSRSLKLYEASLLPWFAHHLLPELAGKRPSDSVRGVVPGLAMLTPPGIRAPRSSLVHMFETIRREFGGADSVFAGQVADDGAWALHQGIITRVLEEACAMKRPLMILGTAFSFVHLIEHLEDRHANYELPAGSRVLETGGYKGRSRVLSKASLHTSVARNLGIASDHIVSEYGMSELGSQAYDQRVNEGDARTNPSGLPRRFHFPPWARVRVISPETGREVEEGDTGLVRLCDLANVYSVGAIQTEDLGVRRGDGFELIGRAAQAESRGCSLLAV